MNRTDEGRGTGEAIEPSATSQATPGELVDAHLTLLRNVFALLLKMIISGAVVVAVLAAILYASGRVRIATIFGADVIIIRL